MRHLRWHAQKITFAHTTAGLDEFSRPQGILRNYHARSKAKGTGDSIRLVLQYARDREESLADFQMIAELQTHLDQERTLNDGPITIELLNFPLRYTDIRLDGDELGHGTIRGRFQRAVKGIDRLDRLQFYELRRDDGRCMRWRRGMPNF